MFTHRIAWIAVAICLAPSIAVAQDDDKKAEKPAFKRLDKLTDEELRKQLLAAPEVGFDQNGAAFVYNPIKKAKDATAFPADFGMKVYGQLAINLKQTDRAVLPWKMGPDCQLGKESAERLQVFSVNLRLYMRRATPPNDVRPDAKKLRDLMNGKGIYGDDKPLKWDRAEAVPTLVQMLQPEGEPLRLLLVEFLAKIKGKDASVGLARRALFDLSTQVREKAVEALVARPSEEYEQTLIDGLRWPWAPAADHAAEALAALKLKDAVPSMVKMLKEPDPALPYAEGKSYLVREMVRVNHLSNCTLCHALSTSKSDLVRGRIPSPGEDMPPLYYAEVTGLFIRADTTYLKQDFSVVQPVTNPVKWPGHQRYDYLLRTRKATPTETKFLQGLEKDKKLSDPYPQREAVLFALRGITGTDRGTHSESWLELLKGIEDRPKDKD